MFDQGNICFLFFAQSTSFNFFHLSVVDETHDAIKMPFLAPSWQIHPPSGNEGRVMYNEYSDCHRRRAIHTMLKTGGPAMSEVLYGFEDHHHFFDEPASILTYPVHSNFDEKNKTMVGFITITFNWLDVFWNILPETISGIIAVIETSSEQTTSFRIDGKQVSAVYNCVFPGLISEHILIDSSSTRVFSWVKEIFITRSGMVRI